MATEFLQSRRLIKLAALLLVSLLLLACETVGYYSQAVRGQLAIVLGRQDIERLLQDETLDPLLAERFRELLSIREFAASELALPVEDNYSSYVDVGREHVVWNVFAAPEFSVDPLNWCYPIAGCVSYRGYFSEQAANRYAGRLADEGYDVYTGGVDAYSTLGWFDDSLLSTVLDRDSYQLAGLIFHELAHQVLYLPGDTTFNESFATTVERAGVSRWLAANGQEQLLVQAETQQRRQAQFIELVSDYRDRFATLYESDLQESLMRQRKQQLQQQMRADYQQLKAGWDGYQGYDAWFARSLNNAQLSTVSSYNDLVPFFTELLRQCEGDFALFYQRVQELVDMEARDREQVLSQ
jgi:predicted aminopeptidase